jgi:hypothetical protein
MSQFVHGPTKSFPANAAIAKFLRVKLLSTGKFDTAGAADIDLGTLEEASFVAGDMRAIRLRNAEGTKKMVANGAITLGVDVFAAASGKISATPSGFHLGMALEAATADGDVIEVLPGGGGGLRVARGQQTTVAASDTVVTGLNTVVAAVACLDSDPIDNPEWVSCSIGDQAGAPAAGSILVKTWQNTAGNDPTPTAATTFGKKVNWIAVGT